LQTKKKEWKNDDEIYYLLLCKLISFCIFVRRFWWYWYLQKLQEMKWIEIYWTCKLLSSLSNMLIPFLKYYLLDSNNWACYKYFQFIDYSNTNFSVESKMPIFFVEIIIMSNVGNSPQQFQQSTPRLVHLAAL
jgi:hypothetical protein